MTHLPPSHIPEGIAVFRPMNGHYQQTQEMRRDVFEVIFAEGQHVLEGAQIKAGFGNFVLDKIWSRLEFIESEIGVITQVDGFTRPIFDITMDLYEAFARHNQAAIAFRFASRLFGDRTGEFVVSLGRLAFSYGPETIDDVEELERPGPRRVGPLPANVRAA